MPKNKVNSPVFVYNDSHLSLKLLYHILCFDNSSIYKEDLAFLY